VIRGSWIAARLAGIKSTMSDGELKRWAETWKRAGPELERARREELRCMTDDDVRRAGERFCFC
jgi:hypothetical protein